MSIVEHGYAVCDLGRRAREAAEGCRKELGEMLDWPLEGYDGDDLQRHAKAAQAAAVWTRKIIDAELGYFLSLLGGDLHIQRQPFLRISRPGIADDNIGLHRDTWYGDTPHEISVWIPFTDTDEDNALRVAPKSHLWSDAQYPAERVDGSVEKGSEKHALGFIHGQPKRLAKPVATIPLPVRVGQMIVFSLALLHGVEVNKSKQTRVSMDVRLTNSLAPVKFGRSRDDRYYETLWTSPVTEIARRYYEAQKWTKSTTTS